MRAGMAIFMETGNPKPAQIFEARLRERTKDRNCCIFPIFSVISGPSPPYFGLQSPDGVQRTIGGQQSRILLLGLICIHPYVHVPDSSWVDAVTTRKLQQSPFAVAGGSGGQIQLGTSATGAPVSFLMRMQSVKQIAGAFT